MKKFLVLLLFLPMIFSCSNSYSSGNRIGTITKFSNKGLIWKSWEGELKVSPNGAREDAFTGQYETFEFSIDNDATIVCETSTDSIIKYAEEGYPVRLEYTEVFGFNWFSNRGDTRHFVRKISSLHKEKN